MSSDRHAKLVAALEHLQAGRFAAVRTLCAPMQARNAGDIEASLFLGLAAGAEGKADVAARLLARVARQRPGFAHPCLDLAALLQQMGRGDLIAPQYRASLACAPDNVNLHVGFAHWLRDAGEDAEALAVLAVVHRLDPNFAPAHNLAGLIHAARGEHAAAIARFRAAAAILPDDATAWTNLGMLLKVEDRFDEAMAAYDRAVALAPDDTTVRLNRAVALLRAGRLGEAWADYEARLRGTETPALPVHKRLPTLSATSDLGGRPDLAGRIVLVTHADGFGDTLQFARYLPLLAARGAQVLVWVPRELAAVVAAMPGVAGVLSGNVAAPPFDFHVRLPSLPAVFATTLETIPATIPYLRAEPVRAAAWAGRLPAGGLRVGLAWAGQARPDLPGFSLLDRRRSMALETLAPLAGLRDVRFISLQMGPAAADPPPPGLELHDPMAGVSDFADTAGILANLDLVVSVDTSVVHLAGAMGVPVFLLDRYDNCWRWLAGREDSPWYPTLRIFRQPAMGDWATPIRRAAHAIQEMAQRQIALREHRAQA